MVPEPEDISDNLLNLSIRSKEEMGYSEERFDNGKSNKIQENCKIKYIVLIKKQSKGMGILAKFLELFWFCS